MANRRLSMRKIREVLRLRWENRCSSRQIARSCGIARSTVEDYINRAVRGPGLSWPLPPELDDTALETLLFSSSATVPLALGKHHYPSLEELHRELARPNMTLKLLWDEYKQAHPTDTSIASFVSSTTSGRPNSMYRCASVTGPGRRCLSIMPEKPCRSSILALVRSWKPVSLLPRWGPAATPMQRLLFPRICLPGSAPMCGPSNSLRVCRRFWFPIICYRGSPIPVVTSRTSTRPSWPAPSAI